MMIRDMFGKLCRVLEGVIRNRYGDLLVGIKLGVVFLHLDLLFYLMAMAIQRSGDEITGNEFG
jgi:hypothetical protein